MTWQSSVLQWLVHSALGGFVFLALGCLAVRFCRQPVRRLRLIELTLLGCLLVPWVNQLPGLPQWFLGWIDLGTPATAEVPLDPTDVAGTETIAWVLPQPPPQTYVPIAKENEAAAPAPPVASTSLPESVTSSRAAPVEIAPSAARSASAVVLTVYGCMVAVLFVWWLVGIAKLLQLYRSTRLAPEGVVNLFCAIAGPEGRRVRLLASDRIELPLMFSWWRPVVVLPASLCEQSDSAALRYCLAHEWSHVERRDAWRWHLAALAQFFFFYQPLFWWLRRQLRLCQDYLADARAAEQAKECEDYAEYLVGLARLRLGVPVTAALGIGDRRSNLYRRIIMLLQNREPLERRCRWIWSLGITLGALFVLGAVASLRLDARASADDKKDPPAKEASRDDAKKENAKKEDDKKVEALHYTGRVFDKDTDKGIPGATVTVRRSLLGDPELKEQNPIMEETKHKTDAEGKYSFTIPPDQVAKRYLYIELDVEAPNYAPRKHFGYALSMILKNEKIGGRPFFENVDMRGAKEITGVIKTPDDKPAANVKVLAYSNTDKKTEMFEYGSFADARTDDLGRFQLWIITPGPAYVWLLPEKFVPETHVLKDDKRGDLGAFILKDGLSIRGKVVDAEGKPLPGVNVNAESQDRNEEITLPVADNINRSAVTNDKGEFEMNPLPPGNYTIKPDEHARDGSKDDRKQRPVPAVFIAKKLVLKVGEKPEPVEVRAAPHVTIEAQYYDPKGKKTRGHEFHVFGRIDGTFWFGQGKGDGDGHIVANIPHGLEQVQVNLMTNEHGVLRWRRGKDGALNTSRRLDLGTVNDDVKDIELIRYEAPIVVVKVTTKDGSKPKSAAVSAEYVAGKQPYEGRLILKNGIQSDVSFEEQEDGRFRSMQMLPDEEVTLLAHADGYESKPMKLKLAEGEKKDIEIVLEKATEKKDEKKEDKK